MEYINKEISNNLRIKKLEDYRKFVNDIIHGNSLDEQYSHLEKYRENLKVLFDEYDLDFFLQSTYCESDDWSHYVEAAVRLVRNMDNNLKISQKTIEAIRTAIQPRGYYLIEFLMALYIPQYLYKKNFDQYIWISHDLFTTTKGYWYHDDIDTGIDYLDDYYNYLKELCLNDEKRFDYFHYNCHILNIIVSYLVLHNMYSRDTLTSYLDNYEYFDERIKMLGINLDYRNTKVMKYIFNNFDYIFGKREVICR